MKVSITNQGDHAIRVILDHDNVHDFQLEAGADDVFEAIEEGVIELRELGGDEEAEARDPEKA